MDADGETKFAESFFFTIFLVSNILMELLALDLISGVFILFSAMFNMYATLLMTSKCLFRKRVAFASKGVLIDAKLMTALSCIFFS